MELVGDGTDNPEQRIEQDCAQFASQTLDISIDLLSQVMTLVTFVAILWGLSGGITLPIFGGIVIPGYMVWVALLYSIVGHLADLQDRPTSGTHQFRPAAL